MLQTEAKKLRAGTEELKEKKKNGGAVRTSPPSPTPLIFHPCQVTERVPSHRGNSDRGCADDLAQPRSEEDLLVTLSDLSRLKLCDCPSMRFQEQSPRARMCNGGSSAGGAEGELESFLFFVFTVLIKFYLFNNNM